MSVVNGLNVTEAACSFIICRFVYLRGERSELHRQQKETNYEFLYVQLAKVPPCEGSDHLQADFISQSESDK